MTKLSGIVGRKCLKLFRLTVEHQDVDEIYFVNIKNTCKKLYGVE
jgi:hypothetical protein